MLEDIYTGEPEDQIYDEFDYAEDMYSYRYIFDSNSGKLYEIYSIGGPVTTLVPLFEETYGIERYKYESEKKGNSLKVKTYYFENGYKITDTWEDDINLTKLTNKWVDGQTGEIYDDKCMYFPIPGEIEVKD